MPELSYHSPLMVPAGAPVTGRSQKRYDSGFSPSLTIDEALRYFEEEVQKLPGDAYVLLHSNYKQLNAARLRKKHADDSAVCCEIKLEGKSHYIYVHQWGLTEQNIYAIHLALRALHNMVQWGVGSYESLLQAFWAKSQAQASGALSRSEEELVSRGQWLAILRLQPDATLDEANTAYRFYAKKAAGSEEGLLRLNQAIEAARKYFQS